MKKPEIMLRPLMLCNWNCDYCGFNERQLTKQKLVDEDWVLEKIDYIWSKYPENEYNISGGEPGLMSEKFFLEIAKKIKKYDIKFVTLETNGEAFKHEIDFSIFNKIRYHSLIDISKDDNIRYPSLPDNYNVEYITIFTKDMNFPMLRKHLEKYDELYKKRICNIKPDIMFLDERIKNINTKEFLIRLALFIMKMNKRGYRLSYRHLHFNDEISQADIKKCQGVNENIDISFSTNYIALCTYYAFLDARDFPITNENLEYAINGQYKIDHPYCQECTKLRNIFNPDNILNKLLEIK